VPRDINPPTVVPYVALTYCWGEANIFKLRTTDSKDLEQHVPSSSLSKTIQVALVVTKDLGIRYLWVNSLCIIHNSGEDWKEQSARMEEIYRHNICMIAATAAKSPHEGLGRCRNSLQTQLLTYRWRRSRWSKSPVGTAHPWS
jgi:hypothetical protein